MVEMVKMVKLVETTFTDQVRYVLKRFLHPQILVAVLLFLRSPVAPSRQGTPVRADAPRR